MSLTTNALIVSPVLSRDTVIADIGYSYTASTVPGTGLLGHAAPTTFDETKAIFYCYNGENSNLSIYPTFLRLTMTVLPVGNTMQKFTTILDQGNRFSAYVAGNALPLVNQNQNSQNASAAQIGAGAITLTAATSSRRIVSHRLFRPVIGVVGDVYQFSYGSGELVDPSALPVDGTARAHVMYILPPLVIPPNTMLAIHAWGATFSTGATYEFEFGYTEK
jgi:hypothetical protein